MILTQFFLSRQQWTETAKSSYKWSGKINFLVKTPMRSSFAQNWHKVRELLGYRRLTSKNLPTSSSTFDRLIAQGENLDGVLAIAKGTSSIQILPVYFHLIAPAFMLNLLVKQ